MIVATALHIIFYIIVLILNSESVRSSIHDVTDESRSGLRCDRLITLQTCACLVVCVCVCGVVLLG